MHDRVVRWGVRELDGRKEVLHFGAFGVPKCRTLDGFILKSLRGLHLGTFGVPEYKRYARF